MKTKQYLGVSLVSDSPFDVSTRKHMGELVHKRFSQLSETLKRKPTRLELAESLVMDRWRLGRILKGLEIINLF